MTRLIAVLLVAFLCGGCDDGSHSRSTPLPQEAFVWQRIWTPEVSQEVQRATMSWLHVLAAELRFDQDKPVITTVEPNWKALTGFLGQKGAVIRIHASAAKTEWNASAVQALQSLLSTTRQRFEKAGVSLEEIQLDYDCPESRLADYTRLMRELRKVWPDVLKGTVSKVFLKMSHWPTI